jgi:hypothetical protein
MYLDFNGCFINLWNRCEASPNRINPEVRQAGKAMAKRGKFLVWLGVLVLALLSYPLLSIVDRDLCYAGIPLLLYYFYGVWVLAIVMLFWGKRFLSS